jgi:hypothetical protein
MPAGNAKDVDQDWADDRLKASVQDDGYDS